MLFIILIFSFISALLIFQPILKVTMGKQKVITRLNKYTDIETVKEEKRKRKTKEFRSGINIIAKGIKGLKFLDGYKKSVQLQLNRAHLLLKAEEYITFGLIIFFVSGLLAFSLTKYIPTAVLIGVIGWFIPKIILRSKIKNRIKNLNDQLGDAIVLISNSLKAGYSFFQAIDIVGKEMTGPIAEEFLLLQKEINLGLPVERAFENLVKRVSSDDLELVITAVLIQRQIGGNLAEVLDNISSTIRDRVKIKGEVRTITAQGRMSGLIISLLPLILGLLIYLINPEHISVLFTSQIGIAIIIFSVFMELIGIYFISRIVKIEV